VASHFHTSAQRPATPDWCCGYFFLVLFEEADGLIGPAGNPFVLAAEAFDFTTTFFGFFSSRLPLPMPVLLAAKWASMTRNPVEHSRE
jgi:hypothetical protein